MCTLAPKVRSRNTYIEMNLKPSYELIKVASLTQSQWHDKELAFFGFLILKIL